MTYQLRRYRIDPADMDAFITAWRDNVVPLRRAHGFTVVGAWADRSAGSFVWIIAHDGDADAFQAAHDAYYASDGRRALTGDRDPGSYLRESDLQLLEAVPV